MSESAFYIEKKRNLKPAEDYEFLREAGLEYIESLGHKLWTDYNAHDPGITILEVLCYAITELGYRANFDIADLLTNEQGRIQNESFFSAKEILTNAPLTALDYRKAIIDIDGVNNAWLIYSNGDKDAMGYEMPLANEVPIYLNPKEDKLSLKKQDKFMNKLDRLPLRGLNKIIVELSDDLILGDLNKVALNHSWWDGSRFIEVDVTAEFDSWNDVKASWLKLMNKPTKIKFKKVEEVGDAVKISAMRTINEDHTLEIYIKPHLIGDLNTVKDHFSIEKTICEIIDLLAEKKKKVDAVFAEIDLFLSANRNLTEDWLCTETIQEVEIGICADIHLKNGADAEEVLALIGQAIDRTFLPPIPFYTLSQLLDIGKSPKEIFNGPSLKHGFLMDEDVEKAQLLDCIHASNLIETLLDIPGIHAVNDLMLTAYDQDGNPLEDAANQSWCLSLDGQKKPVFDFNKSKLLLFRDGVPFLIPERGKEELAQGTIYLKTQNDTLKLEDSENDFAIPSGSYFQLNEYYSIQNDFPTTYGIGKGHLLKSSPDLRKAQAKQLKAYLQNFDQLLADFFNQLHHAKNLYDLKPIENTYFANYVDDISGIDEEFFAEEVYREGFKVTLEGNKESNRSVYETTSLFHDRRNRVLDHLMARFGESFSDYVFMNHMMQQNAQGLAELTIQEQELIEDKQRFLKQYPALSYARGLALNYCQEEDASFAWGLTKRGGYEKRVAALLGINHIPLQDLVDDDPKNNWSYDTVLGTLEFQLLNTVPMAQEEKWALAHELMQTVDAYIADTFSKSYIYFVNEDGKKIVKFTKEFDSEKEATEFIPKLYQALNDQLENFYCLEHLLLRPLFYDGLKDEDLLTVCLNDNCFSEDHNDPYSFKATIVLPGWLARFRNRYFREYAETIFRQEAPAHCLIKVCWVGQDDMIGFQKAYYTWITLYRKHKDKFCDGSLSETSKKQYNKALSELISWLKGLNSIYDKGTLYDCQESELDNPIILNNSSLGTLKNIDL